MRQDMIRQIFSGPKSEEEKKPLNPLVVWLVIGAILFLAVSSFWGSDKDEKKEKTVQETVEDAGFSMDYVSGLEERLIRALEKISGTGKVSVFINIEDGGEQVLAEDRTQKSQEDNEETVTTSRTEEESHVILWEQDGAEGPYIVKRRFPEPTGILVVSEGAGNEVVRQEIYEAVRAIFGLPAHRIKITN